MNEVNLGLFEPMVYRFILYLIRDVTAAEDLTQETFKIALGKGIQAILPCVNTTPPGGSA
ncbi:MAG: hypothetical protein O3B01_21940 [Planctomycetota bacterium]|nr:hypothetical protein [Planctomycetota bacterium]